MQTRLETLRRLVTLYAAVEEMHSAELRQTTAAIREAQQAIVVESEIARTARMDGREALLTGNRVGRLAAETEQEMAGWRRQRLEQIRIERETLNDLAAEHYVASRLRKEQIKRVFDDIAAGMEIVEGRRTQAASDDRFLARRRWTDVREKIPDVNR